MSSIISFSLLFLFICVHCSFSKSGPPPAGPKPGTPLSGQKKPVTSTDPNSVYKSFLECLPTQSPQPDPSFPSIVHSPTANASTYTQTLKDRLRNLRYDAPSAAKPAIIATPTKETHVQAIVLCAKKLGVQIKIRSGGHDYEAMSYVSSEKSFMILDMFNLRSVEVNIPTGTAVVQAGAHLGELYYRIWEKSKVHGYPAGVCPTIGVGGHISGAGYGTMIRKFGLSIDHVIDAKIVNAAGKILDRKSMGEDLFWALRGGGGSSFGVILSFTLKLVVVPNVTTVFRLDKFLEPNTADIIMKWQSIMPTIDNDLYLRVVLNAATVDNKKTVKVTFVSHFLGDSTRLLTLMSKSFPELGLKKTDCTEVNWFQSLLYWANFDLNTTKPEKFLDQSSSLSHFKRKSDFVQTPIPKPGWTAILNKVAEFGGGVWVGFNPYGGKMSEVPANATAMPHRAGNLFKVQYSADWKEADAKASEDNMKKGRVMFEFMTGYVSKNPRGAYTNYRDFDIGVNSGDGFNSGKVYGEKYWKGNFDRLVKVKTTVDPDNFFRNEQSIPTSRK